DCYAGWQRQLEVVGPPHITYSHEFGYILRADYTLLFRNAKPEKGRLVCWKGLGSIGSRTDLSLPPLEPPGSSTLDSATQRAIPGWQARRAAEAEAEAERRRQAQRAAEAERIAKVQSYPAPDSTATAQLEGIWLIGKEPDKGPCISN